MSQNIASKLVAMSVLFPEHEGARWDMIAVGLDPQARNHYLKDVPRWRGTRFSDGSAVVASGYNRLPVEYLGSFLKEK